MFDPCRGSNIAQSSDYVGLQLTDARNV